MLNSLIRMIVLGVLVIAAIAVFFLVLHIVIRLVILGAIVIAALWVVRSFKGNNRNTEGQ
jgi:hypothetical protein